MSIQRNEHTWEIIDSQGGTSALERGRWLAEGKDQQLETPISVPPGLLTGTAPVTYINEMHVQNYYAVPQNPSPSSQLENPRPESDAELNRWIEELKKATSEMKGHIEDIARELKS